MVWLIWNREGISPQTSMVLQTSRVPETREVFAVGWRPDNYRNSQKSKKLPVERKTANKMALWYLCRLDPGLTIP
jgi:hypothetical protein